MLLRMNYLITEGKKDEENRTAIYDITHFQTEGFLGIIVVDKYRRKGSTNGEIIQASKLRNEV